MTEQVVKREPKNLFDRSYNLYKEVEVLKEDLKELKEEFTYHKEFNHGGLDKGVVARLMKAAKAKAVQDALQDKIDELEAVQAIIDEYAN